MYTPHNPNTPFEDFNRDYAFDEWCENHNIKSNHPQLDEYHELWVAAWNGGYNKSNKDAFEPYGE